jgi:cytoskeletal protein CcmA (bactofilin family)
MRAAVKRSPHVHRGIVAAFAFLLPMFGATAGLFANTIGGPLSVDGPLTVQGSLMVGGALTVHGPVMARKIIVGGPVETTLPKGEPSGQAGQLVPGGMTVGGPLTVNGPLAVDGTLTVGGPMHCESAAETAQGLQSSATSQLTE